MIFKLLIRIVHPYYTWLGIKNYEGEIFLSNGTDIVDEVSLRLTNKNDAYDYRTLYQIVFN